MEDLTPQPPADTVDNIEAIGLPDGVCIYVGGGIPSVFRRLGSSGDGSGEEWLYLPDRVLDEIVSSVPSEHRIGPIRAGSVELDDSGRLHPLIIGACVRACLVDLRESPADNDIPWHAALGWLVQGELRHFHESPMTSSPPPSLVTCDTTPDRLVRTSLNLLVEQVPEGLAATYDERDGLYRMRTAVGNIAMWDILEGELPHSTASRWQETIDLGRWFLPAGFLPERPMLLTAAPDFLFVHRGVQSDKTPSLIAMPVPGTISRAAGERAVAVARMIEGLHENRLGMTEDLLLLCSQLDSAFRNHRSLDSLLKDLFETLHRRLGLSRLVFYPEGRECRTVLKRIQEEPVVRADAEPVIASTIRLAATAGRTFVPDLSVSNPLSEAEAKRYYLDNVRSEFCFRLLLNDGPDLFIAFGSPEIGGRLRQAERLLEVTVSFLRLYCGYLKVSTARPTQGAGGDAGGSPLGGERLRTVAALADGHFHSMFDTLSWMLGETELSSAGVETDDSAGSLQSFTRAIERLVGHLDRVRRLVHEAPDDDQRAIPAHRLLADLPAIFEGYSHWLQDTKDIAVQIHAARPTSPSFSLSRGEAYDLLYPVLTAIMGSATHSGEVHVRAVRVDRVNAIEITCPRHLLEPAGLAAVIERWSGRRHDTAPSGRTTHFLIGDCTWECSSETDDPQCARLLLTGRTTDRNRPGRQAAPKTEVR